MSDDLEQLARAALAEDAPAGDLTSRRTVPAGTACTAEILAKQDGVLAGVAAAAAVFAETADQDQIPLTIDWKLAEGAVVVPGDRVALIDGAAATVLRAERPALNLLGHLSGIATLTRTYVGCGRARADPVHAQDACRAFARWSGRRWPPAAAPCTAPRCRTRS